jgi:proton glutamate symport protein
MITSKGVAGVPRASLVILLGTAASFNLPEWPILAILGIDGLMDMARTAVNVIGNCLASVVIAQWEGVFRPNFASGLYDGYPLADVAAAGLQPGDIEKLQSQTEAE